MPDDFQLSAIAQAAPTTTNKKPKLKIRRKGNAEGAKKDEKSTKKATENNPAHSSPNGLREEDENVSNRSDDLTGEDYEKLAKLLQVSILIGVLEF